MISRRRHASSVPVVPAPFDILSLPERLALWRWTRQWGEVSLVLENPKPKRYSDMGPLRVPMIELHGRRGYARLHFQRWRIAQAMGWPR